MAASRSKTCPRCAERVKAAAQVCRYCGHEFGAPPAPAKSAATRPTWPIVAAVVIGAVALIVLLGWAMAPTIDHRPVAAAARRASAPVPTTAPVPAPAVAAGPELAVGDTLEWQADREAGTVVRQVGPIALRITRRLDGDLVAPVLTLSSGDQSVVMTGETASPAYAHRITALRNTAGAAPVVLLQSFSGGAHCCNRMQVGGFSGGRLTVVDLGAWDGGTIDTPTDISGDGVADFVQRDNAFLYAFAAYAMSDAPPVVLNVQGGRRVDVSRRPAFRRLFLDTMKRAGENCRTGEDGMTRNGACPAYVAAAARVGRLDAAWADMLRAYSPDEGWELPKGCAVPARGECPAGSDVTYADYPEALLAFLKAHGYVAAGWQPRSDDEPSPRT